MTNNDFQIYIKYPIKGCIFFPARAHCAFLLISLLQFNSKNLKYFTLTIQHSAEGQHFASQTREMLSFPELLRARNIPCVWGSH